MLLDWRTAEQRPEVREPSDYAEEATNVESRFPGYRSQSHGKILRDYPRHLQLAMFRFTSRIRSHTHGLQSRIAGIHSTAAGRTAARFGPGIALAATGLGISVGPVVSLMNLADLLAGILARFKEQCSPR
jgi:hypothetical protein